MSGAATTIRDLADRIRTLETSLRPCAATTPLAGGLSELFPHGRLTAGSLVELLPSMPGAGAWTLALLLARHACGETKTLMIADAERCFYPPAVGKLGVNVRRAVVLRPRVAGEALAALAQGLRCPAIGAALGACERLTDRDGRRLQLAAESGGSLGVLLRPASARAAPSFAAVRLLLEPLPYAHGKRRMRVEVLRSRGGQEGKTLCLEIDDATGHVRAFSVLELAAAPAAAARSTG